MDDILQTVSATEISQAKAAVKAVDEGQPCSQHAEDCWQLLRWHRAQIFVREAAERALRHMRGELTA